MLATHQGVGRQGAHEVDLEAKSFAAHWKGQM